MEPYQERMLVELKEINEITEKMQDFSESDKIKGMPIENLGLLLKQDRHMTRYEHVLRLRCGQEGIL